MTSPEDELPELPPVYPPEPPSVYPSPDMVPLSAPGSIMAEPFPFKSFEEFPFSMMTWMVLSLEELLVSSPEKNPSRSEDELSESGDWLSEPEELSESNRSTVSCVDVCDLSLFQSAVG